MAFCIALPSPILAGEAQSSSLSWDEIQKQYLPEWVKKAPSIPTPTAVPPTNSVVTPPGTVNNNRILPPSNSTPPAVAVPPQVENSQTNPVPSAVQIPTPPPVTNADKTNPAESGNQSINNNATPGTAAEDTRENPAPAAGQPEGTVAPPNPAASAANGSGNYGYTPPLPAGLTSGRSSAGQVFELGSFTSDGPNGMALFQVEESQFKSAQAHMKPGQLLISAGLPTGFPADKAYAINIPAGVSRLAASTGSLKIAASHLELEIPALDLKALVGTTANPLPADLELIIRPGLNKVSGSSHLTMLGNPLSIELSQTLGKNTGSGIQSLPAALSMGFKVQLQGMKSADIERLGVYFHNKDSQWQYIGGRLDKTHGLMQCSIKTLGSYSIGYASYHFQDLDQHWAREAVEIMAARHVVSGVAPGVFQPSTAVTRAQFASMISRTLGLPGAAGQSFSDVGKQDWYQPAVAAVTAAGIMSGTGNGRFYPERPISREEMASVLARAAAREGRSLNLADKTLQSYTDARQVANWAQADMNRVVTAGLMGSGSTVLRPRDNSSRAEAVVVLKNLIRYLGYI